MGTGLPFVPWAQSSLPRGLVPKAFKGTSTGGGAATWGRRTVKLSSRHTEKLGKEEVGKLVCGDKSF